MYKAASGTRFVLWKIDRGSEQQNSIKPHSKKKKILKRVIIAIISGK